MPSFHLTDPGNIDVACTLDIRSVLSKAEVLSTLKQALLPSVSQHIECVQFYAHPSPIDRLGAFVTFHTPDYARQAIQTLRKHSVHYHTLGAQVVTSSQQPGYHLPYDLALPTRPFSAFRVFMSSPQDDNGSSHRNGIRSIPNTSLSSFAVLNIHGIIDQAELEHILRLRVTPRVPIVCVQVWRARSSQALHAYITFVCRAHAQWAASQLHGRKGTHTWNCRGLKTEDVNRCARPPTEEEKSAAKAAASENAANGDNSSAMVSGGATNRLVFSPTAVIIPFYATLLPSTSGASTSLNSLPPLGDSTSSDPNVTERNDQQTVSCVPQASYEAIAPTSDPTSSTSASPKGIWRDSGTQLSSLLSPCPPLPSFCDNKINIEKADDLYFKTPQLRLAPPTPPSPSTYGNTHSTHCLHTDLRFYDSTQPAQPQIRPLSVIRAQSQPAVSLNTLLPDSQTPDQPKAMKQHTIMPTYPMRARDSSDPLLPCHDAGTSRTYSHDIAGTDTEDRIKRPGNNKRAATMIEMSMFAHQPIVEQQDTSFELAPTSQPPSLSATTTFTAGSSSTAQKHTQYPPSHDYFSASHHGYGDIHTQLDTAIGRSRAGDGVTENRFAFDPFGEAGQLSFGSASGSAPRSRSPHPHPLTSEFECNHDLGSANHMLESQKTSESRSHQQPSLGIGSGTREAREVKRSMLREAGTRDLGYEATGWSALSAGKGKGMASGDDVKEKVKRSALGDASNMQKYGNTLSLSDRVSLKRR